MPMANDITTGSWKYGVCFVASTLVTTDKEACRTSQFTLRKQLTADEFWEVMKDNVLEEQLVTALLTPVGVR